MNDANTPTNVLDKGKRRSSVVCNNVLSIDYIPETYDIRNKKWLRAAAGLPIQDEIFNISPYSDSEDDGPPLKKDNKYGKEKGFLAPRFGRIEYSDAQSIGSLMGDNKDEDVQSRRNGEPETTRLIDEVWPVDRTEAVKTKQVDVVPVKTHSRVLRDKQKKITSHINRALWMLPKKTLSNPITPKDKSWTNGHLVQWYGGFTLLGKVSCSSLDPTWLCGLATKAGIHLGARNKNVANSLRSDSSNSLPEQVWTTPNEEVEEEKWWSCGGGVAVRRLWFRRGGVAVVVQQRWCSSGGSVVVVLLCWVVSAGCGSLAWRVAFLKTQDTLGIRLGNDAKRYYGGKLAHPNLSYRFEDIREEVLSSPQIGEIHALMHQD
ncbi:hypothetical protein Tco_1506978 [Tanacetum coccineum]